eukprot:jgi/Chrzof1/13658/Cz08g07020.t1
MRQQVCTPSPKRHTNYGVSFQTVKPPTYPRCLPRCSVVYCIAVKSALLIVMVGPPSARVDLVSCFVSCIIYARTRPPELFNPPCAGLRPAGALSPVIRGASLLHAPSGVLIIYSF